MITIKLRELNMEMMKWSAILLLSVTLVYSCSFAQENSQVVKQYVPMQFGMVKGDTVKELGIHLMVVFQDSKDNYWFGSWGEGLYRYDGTTILHFTTKHGLCHNRIESILEDKSGNIFFNTSEGVSKFDGLRFTTLPVTNDANAVWKLEPDDLWFKGAQDAGVVFRYDGQSLFRLELPAIQLGEDFIAQHPREVFPNMKSSPYDVYTIYRDTKGNVWFGTGVIGLCRYNGTSVDWITEDDVTELHNGPANGVRSIIEDKEGKFWFCNTLYRYIIYQDNESGKGKSDKSDKSVFTYVREKGIGSLDGKTDGDLNEYLSAVVDDKGDVWIVTYTAGVWKYDGKDITHYPVKDGAKDITLFTIYKDNLGNLWLGTHDNGTYKFNGKTFERFIP